MADNPFEGEPLFRSRMLDQVNVTEASAKVKFKGNFKLSKTLSITLLQFATSNEPVSKTISPFR